MRHWSNANIPYRSINRHDIMFAFGWILPYEQCSWISSACFLKKTESHSTWASCCAEKKARLHASTIILKTSVCRYSVTMHMGVERLWVLTFLLWFYRLLKEEVFASFNAFWVTVVCSVSRCFADKISSAILICLLDFVEPKKPWKFINGGRI